MKFQLRRRALLPLTAAMLSGQTHALQNVLIYSKTTGYRHDSIPTAIESIRTLSSSLFTPTFSEDSSLFTTSSLSKFDVIAFLSNSNTVDASSGVVTSDVLDDEGVEALRLWLTGEGHGLVGLHAATACLFEDESFGVGMGSWFDYHPTIQNATFTKLVSHPTINMLPDRYNTYEEVYNFRTDPRSVNATVLLTVDSTSYVDPEIGTRPYYQGSPHPIAWYRDSSVDLGNGTRNGTMMGRMWMTSLGHTNETWQSSLHIAHVKAGFQWVLAGSSGSNSTTTSTGTASKSSTTTTTNSAISTAARPSSAAPKNLREFKSSMEFVLAAGAVFVAGFAVLL